MRILKAFFDHLNSNLNDQRTPKFIAKMLEKLISH